MGFESLHENVPFLKQNRVAVPGRTVRFQQLDKQLPEPQLKDDELPQFAQEIRLTGGDYSNPITYYWNAPVGTTIIGYYLDEEVDAAIFFDSLVPGQNVRWIDPETQVIKEYFYSAFVGGFINEIGNVKPGQGYIMLSFTAPATIARAGVIGDPVTHTLEPAFNILAYMGDTPIDAQVAFQDVIDAGVLSYVEWRDPSDLSVKRLEWNGSMWVNDIGNVERGQGYVVRVTGTYAGFVF